MDHKSRYVWPGWFSLEFPEAWTFEEDQGSGTISFYNETSGAGAITISMLRRKHPATPSIEDAIELAKDYKAGAIIDQYDTTQIDGCPASYFGSVMTKEGEQEYWEVWHVVSSGRVIFLTYNCGPDDVATEARERNDIIRSIRWEE